MNLQLDELFIPQPVHYSADQHRVWQALCTRQLAALRDLACCQFVNGLDRIGLDYACVPRLDNINDQIAPITGWQARAVQGLVKEKLFFACLQRGIYPTTVTIRTDNAMDYIEEPDIFHDVFGHVALMADPAYGQLLRRFGSVYSLVKCDRDLEELTRLFWFTIEFGLINQDGQTRLLGAGLLSSPGEAQHCLSSGVERERFELNQVISQSFRVDVYQDRLFIADSLEQLIDATHVLEGRMHARNGGSDATPSRPSQLGTVVAGSSIDTE